MHRNIVAVLIACVALEVLGAADRAVAQTAVEVEQVRNAMKAAYIRESAIEPCKAAVTERFGWPASLVVKCTYLQRDKLPSGPTIDRKAVAEAVFPDPAVIARWIVSACQLLKTPSPACFSRLVAAGESNSGFQFPITGNVLEDFPPTGRQKNYFFRTGMTVSVAPNVNGSTHDMSLPEQEALAETRDEDLISIPSGKTRYWSTTPKQFETRFPGAGAPPDLRTKERRITWLNVVRQEFQQALSSDRSRLLEAWLCSTASERFMTTCTAP